MRLILTIAGQKPRAFELDQGEFTIGRSSKCDLPLESDGISRMHLKIKIDGAGVFVTDLGSSNGSFIDGERLKPNIDTLWITALPVQLGQKVVISMGEEVVAKQNAEIKRIESTLELQRKALDRMIDKPIKGLHPVRSRRTKEASEQSEGVKPSLITMVVLVGIVILVYFHFESRSKIKNVTTEGVNKVPEVKIVENPELIKLATTALAQPKCQGQIESFYCLNLKLDTVKSEGALLLGNTLYLFINIRDKIFKLDVESDFHGFSDFDKNIYIMSSIVFREEIRLQVKDTSIEQILVVELNGSGFRNVLKVPSVNLLKPNRNDIKTIFGRLKTKDNTAFNRFLLPGMEFASAN